MVLKSLLAVLLTTTAFSAGDKDSRSKLLSSLVGDFFHMFRGVTYVESTKILFSSAPACTSINAKNALLGT